MKEILIRGRYSEKKDFAIIDDEDFVKVSKYNWYATQANNRKGYVYCFPRGKDGGILLLHRYIVGIEPSDKRIPDHINHNVWDNRKSNLRVVSRKENSMNSKFRVKLIKSNTSGFRGVCRWRKTQWVVNIQGKFVGIYDTALEAARAYDKVAVETFGDNAITNFSTES